MSYGQVNHTMDQDHWHKLYTLIRQLCPLFHNENLVWIWKSCDKFTIKSNPKSCINLIEETNWIPIRRS